jgi:hypothetical protein
MDQIPYPNFWKEEPDNQKKVWRPTDGAKRKIQAIGILQMLLMAGIFATAILIYKQTRVIPPIYAQLPNGIVLYTSTTAPAMNMLARRELVNNVLPLLYYQEGGNNYLKDLQGSVRATILNQIASKMKYADSDTNVTVALNIIESFETSGNFTGSHQGFEAMTRAELVKQDRKKRIAVPFYLRTHWDFEDGRFVLSGLIDSNPGQYAQLFEAEKTRLHSLSNADLQKELDIRKDTLIPVEQNHSSF